MREAALAIIGEQHRVVLGQHAFVIRQHRLQDFMVRLILEIDSDQLLRATDDAQLDDGVELRIAAQHGGDALLFEQLAQAPRRLVVADHRQQGALRAQRLDVEGHVGSTPEALLLARNAHHRHRRFGRDAIDRAEPIAVEHRITHHQHTGTGEAFRGQGSVGHGVGGGDNARRQKWRAILPPGDRPDGLIPPAGPCGPTASALRLP